MFLGFFFSLSLWSDWGFNRFVVRKISSICNRLFSSISYLSIHNPNAIVVLPFPHFPSFHFGFEFDHFRVCFCCHRSRRKNAWGSYRNRKALLRFHRWLVVKEAHDALSQQTTGDGDKGRISDRCARSRGRKSFCRILLPCTTLGGYRVREPMDPRESSSASPECPRVPGLSPPLFFLVAGIFRSFLGQWPRPGFRVQSHSVLC